MPLVGRNGGNALILKMIFEQLSIVEISQQITIHNREWFIQIMNQRKRSDGMKRLLFQRIIDCYSQL